MILQLFIIQLIVCFIVDYSGFIENGIKSLIRKLLKQPKHTPINLKPIDCSLCTGFWSGLIYICILDQFTFLNLLTVVLFSYLSKHITGILFYIDELFTFIENKLYKLIS